MIKPWFVYILLCKDGSFYCGITNDLDRRILAHSKGKASKYTRSRLPIKLLMTEKMRTKNSALKREAQIKKMSRKQKIKMMYPNETIVIFP